MLRELLPTRQIPGEPQRRWFNSPRCDLIVWLEDDGRPVGFQLCYDKDEVEHALTWVRNRGFNHMRVDTHDRHPYRDVQKGTPLLVPDGVFDARRLLEIFNDEGRQLPPEFAALVAEKLNELAGPASGAPAESKN
jgi:hypothetical protein